MNSQSFDDDFQLLTLREKQQTHPPDQDQVIALLNSCDKDRPLSPHSQILSGLQPARVIAKCRQKLKFYEQIQQMIENRLQQDRSNFFNEEVRLKLQRGQLVERSLSQIEKQAKESSKKRVELIMHKEEIEEAVHHLEAEIGDYEVVCQERQIYEDLLLRLNKRQNQIKKNTLHGKQAQFKAYSHVIQQLSSNMKQLATYESGYRMGNSLQATQDRKRIQGKMKKLNTLRGKLKQLQKSIEMIKHETEQLQNRGQNLQKERQEIQEYGNRMHTLQSELIVLSLNHSKIIKKKRKAEQLLSLAIRQVQDQMIM